MIWDYLVSTLARLCQRARCSDFQMQVKQKVIEV